VIVADDGSIEVFAAGGLVWRRAAASGRQFLVVARPHRGDWSLPKGKLEVGETLEQCALREVLEETGLTCELGARLAARHYVDQRGRSKQVTYWTMTVRTGVFTPNAEVDRIEWLAADDAAQLLSYETDRSVLADGAALLDR
jgi:8-oxo-dGTP pyrophosphatase MutT (NUDIX family)